jgi:L-lactate utilization protein LutB
VGISGANFLVAESGTLVMVENEGNIQLSTCLPRRHIAVVGIDKLIANEEDLAALMRLLPVSATAQRQTCYVSLFADRHPDLHVVLLDNGRGALMADPEQRDLLTCVRCGACMNACPVYRNVGGHAYGGAYAGPIGALLMPQLLDGEQHRSLPFASSLCGACSEACPVAIPLHERLLELRARFAGEEVGFQLGTGLRFGAALMRAGWRMEGATRAYRLVRPLAGLAPLGRAWRSERALPEPAAESFRTWWRKRTPSTGPAAGAAVPEPTEPSATASQTSDAPPSLSQEDQLALFRERLAELGPGGETELHHFPTQEEALTFLRRHVDEHDRADVLVDGEHAEKRDYALGITAAALLIAETGGLVLDREDRTQNRVSMLVETQIAVARSTHVVPNLQQALAERAQRRAGGEWHDYQVIVTGPSRTADVEKVLVIPAHGPRRLLVVLCDESVDLGRLSR